MPPIRVRVGGQVISFPEGTSQEEMATALSRLSPTDKPYTPSSDVQEAALRHRFPMMAGMEEAAKERDTPKGEPDTYWGGFGKGLTDYFAPLGKIMQSAADPTQTRNVVLAAMPTGIPSAVKGGMNQVKMFRQAAAQLPKATEAETGISAITGPSRRFVQTLKAMPGVAERNQMGVNRYMPNTPGDALAAIPPQGPMPQSALTELLDAHMPNTPGETPTPPDSSVWQANETVHPTPSVDRYMPNSPADVAAPTTESATPVATSNRGDGAAQSYIEDYLKSTERPKEWHSGATPGSADAKAAQQTHTASNELDAGYKRQVLDELMAKLFAQGKSQ